ncbi:MAG: hypothetical protein JW869_07315 [Candidatus Omnitrophica bacterium]|nr:hypothetical protein [Candidatus Omnitrophota bacterium]
MKTKSAVLFISILGIFLYGGRVIALEQSLVYEFRAGKDYAETDQRQYVQIEDLPSGEQLFKRKVKADDYTENERFVLGPEGETRSWQLSCSAKDTDYSGERKGDELFIKGIIKGEEVDRKIAIDEKPFYYEPKFNLSSFVLSDAKEIRFWIMPIEKLKAYPMKARKMGEVTTNVNGQDFKAVKIYYAATGIAEKFYHRLYYFRKSDGVFVKKEDPGGSGGTTILVSEDALQ